MNDGGDCPCGDCGYPTNELGEFGDRVPGKREWYVVTDEVWEAAGMPLADHEDAVYSGEGILCVGCLERRLGRELVGADFAPVPLNNSIWQKSLASPRLLAALAR